MQNYRKTSQTTYDCKYHMNHSRFIRMDNQIWEEGFNRHCCRTSTRTHLGYLKKNEVEILKGDVSKDHVPLFVSVPPDLARSKLVQYLKEKSSYKLLSENKDLSKAFRGWHLWGRGYFVATSGNVTEEVIIEYIQNQDNTESDDDFTIAQ